MTMFDLMISSGTLGILGFSLLIGYGYEKQKGLAVGVGVFGNILLSGIFIFWLTA